MATETLFVLPGLVDVHTHDRQPGQEYKEGFEHLTLAAIRGGFTLVLAMPNNLPESIIYPERLANKIILANQARLYCDLGLHYGASPKSLESLSNGFVLGGSFAQKHFMNDSTGDLYVPNPIDRRRIFESTPDGRMMIVHAEGERLAEAIGYLKDFPHIRLHVAHVSLASEVEQIARAKDLGLDITAEVTPHHLFLSKYDSKALRGFGIMKPPLALRRDQKALIKGLNEGIIDMIATDHAPHTTAEKRSANPPFGVTGLETAVLLMATAAYHGIFEMADLAKWMSYNPRSRFGLPAQSDSFVEVQLTETPYPISGPYFTRCGWYPFVNMFVNARVISTNMNGQEIYRAGEIEQTREVIGDPPNILTQFRRLTPDQAIGEPIGKLILPHAA